jgi:two-component system, chemotaxis family, protein-glutamate methylesterase/glutaminase
MPHHDVIVIGGSAGSLKPLTTIVQGLPVGLKASVLVVMHTRAAADGFLPDILGRITPLAVTFAKHAQRFDHGHIYIAQPDRHLILTGGELRLVHGPRENGFRPAIDPLFRTAARELGPRVVGVILSGALSDGAYGLSLIKQHGGVAVVQDPDEANVDSMPRNALSAVDADYILPAAQIAATVTRLIEKRPAKGRANGELRMPRSNGELEPQMPSEHTKVSEMEDRFGAPSPLTCPDCGGALWEVQEGSIVRYQCHTGHQFAPDVLDGEQRDAVDSALWSAVRVLEEHSELKKRMAKRASDNGMTALSAGFAEGARDAHSQAQRIRSLLFTQEPDVSADEAVAKRTSSSVRRRARGKKRGAPKIRPTKRRD